MRWLVMIWILDGRRTPRGGGAADDEVVAVASTHDVPTTVRRLEQAIERAGLRVFDRIDHAAGALSAGLELPPRCL